MIDLTITEKYILVLEEQNKNLKEDFKRHIDRINELTNRIDKALEYLKRLKEKELITEFETEWLIELLEGSDKE